MRVTYGYHMAPTTEFPTRTLRARRLNAAAEDGKTRFPMWTSVEATLSPDAPATGPILVEVTIPDDTNLSEVYGN